MTSINTDVDEVELFLKNGIFSMRENILAIEKELLKTQAEEKSLQNALDKRKAELERSKERLVTFMNLRLEILIFMHAVLISDCMYE
jgi:hypothetical protein